MKIQEVEKVQKGFSILEQDRETKARLGILQTAHGKVETPCFMPCGTQGTVKALSSEELEMLEAQIVLSNAYHLFLRPGKEIFQKVGGLHSFMNWTKAILTDSGGFQVFSLAPLRKVTEEGLFFQSHIDGSRQFLTPESIIQFQIVLGSDIVMVLDECVGYPCEEKEARAALERTLLWGKRSRGEFDRREKTPQLLFGIAQGGVFPKLRKVSCERLMEIGFDGYALGGLGVGEPKELLWENCTVCTGFLPSEKPRYLMGVGTPEDILEGIALGVDLFDCVLPTRNGRNGQVFTSCGTLNLRNASHAEETKPIEEGCVCPACQGYPRAYLHHLLGAKEILGVRLLTLHNIFFYLHLLKRSREAIQKKCFREFKEKTTQQLRGTY